MKANGVIHVSDTTLYSAQRKKELATIYISLYEKYVLII
jgi:hypothetical protein